MIDLLMLGLVVVLSGFGWAFILMCGALMGPVDVRPHPDEATQ